MLRGMAVSGIKSSIPKERWDRFVLVFRGEKELKQAVGFERADDAYLVVLDRTGSVRWRQHGAISESALDEFKKQLAAALQAP